MHKKSSHLILVVDDDRHVIDGLKLLLEDDYNLITASSGKEAIQHVRDKKSIAVVVMDIKMAEMDGIEAARRIREISSDLPIIFHTGFPGEYTEDDIDQNERPFDYIQKGSAVSRLTRSIGNALESFILKTSGDTLIDNETLYGMIGRSSRMKEIYGTLKKVSLSDTKVMILGETGTGKELVARAIHKHSSRNNGRLVIFNCNHRAPDLAESELFGHSKGAFTGAIADRVGLFEYADGGTVFLDEIGDLDITTQAKLLRVLETGEFQTIGEVPKLKTTDVRIICATHHDLKGMVDAGKFREDLYYRLKGVVVEMPPLRERREDIPLLVARFVDQLTVEKNQSPKFFDRSAMQLLASWEWPGNVRQLLDTVQSLLVMSDSDVIFDSDVSAYLGIEQMPAKNGSSLAAQTIEFRKSVIISCLHQTDNNINAAARLLEIDQANLRKLIKNYNIS